MVNTTEFTATSIAAALRQSAALRPDKTALIFGDETWTFSRLDELSDTVAVRLLAAGIHPGERVALHLPNGPELGLAFLGCCKAGFIAVPVSTRLKGREIEHILRHSGAAGYVGHLEFFPVVAALRQNLPDLWKCFIIGDQPLGPDELPFKELLRPMPGGATLPDRSPGETAVILYTSGTTAFPKGVMHSHETLLQIARAVRGMELDERQITVMASPMTHMLGLVLVFLGGLLQGATVVLPARIDAASVLKAIERHRCTHMFGLPALFHALAGVQSATPRDVSSGLYFFCGGDSVSPALQASFESAFGRSICEAYGSTEAVPVTYNRTGRARAGSLGEVAEGVRIRLLDRAGVEVAPGEAGEVCIQTPTLTTGYWQDPEATAAAFRDGWFHTGDLARCDAESYYWFAGRVKQIIIRGGSNVSPQEVEAALLEHLQVREAAVIGRADPVWGEIVVAYVARQEGSSLEAAELIQFAGARLAAFKTPEQIIFRDSLPKTATGKMDRRALREAEMSQATGPA